ncbi:hypothetical protein M427DRAFT_48092 [Gonapodya prolifera JEL478]|uniref:Uncharacterized protein n=1 Tax=Gonapodya prolifera (strain JEL478) TaxID=1344416 RepID=A0A139A1A7_GONPJ|nr:hypothetical protein M427DRAFT_48092 [Gonapodya prolifera JEL478]|eukprot:KXS10514.1 hypothetical protein M427DRAFT_48092 [Gonapodya prolifera JEL478]
MSLGSSPALELTISNLNSQKRRIVPRTSFKSTDPWLHSQGVVMPRAASAVDDGAAAMASRNNSAVGSSMQSVTTGATPRGARNPGMPLSGKRDSHDRRSEGSRSSAGTSAKSDSSNRRGARNDKIERGDDEPSTRENRKSDPGLENSGSVYAMPVEVDQGATTSTQLTTRGAPPPSTKETNNRNNSTPELDSIQRSGQILSQSQSQDLQILAATSSHSRAELHGSNGAGRQQGYSDMTNQSQSSLKEGGREELQLSSEQEMSSNTKPNSLLSPPPLPGGPLTRSGSRRASIPTPLETVDSLSHSSGKMGDALRQFKESSSGSSVTGSTTLKTVNTKSPRMNDSLESTSQSSSRSNESTMDSTKSSAESPDPLLSRKDLSSEKTLRRRHQAEKSAYHDILSKTVILHLKFVSPTSTSQ